MNKEVWKKGEGRGKRIIVGIAANSDEHMNVLSALADAIEDEEDAKKLWQETSVENIFNLLSQSL